MRKAMWALVVLAAGMQAAQANIVLEDFTESDLTVSAAGGNFAGGTIYQNPAAHDYRELTLYGGGAGTTATIDKTAGTFNLTSAGLGQASIHFGYERIDTGTNAWAYTAMNADWSQLTVIRLKGLNLSGNLNVQTVLDTNNMVGGTQYGNNESVSTIIRLSNYQGDLDIPLATFQPAGGLANLADIDAFALALTLPGAGGSVSFDAIELVGVVVPEPASASVAMLGAAALLLRRRGRASA